MWELEIRKNTPYYAVCYTSFIYNVQHFVLPSSIDFAQSIENSDSKLLMNDTGGVCVLWSLLISWLTCLLAWREAVCSSGSGERGRKLISTLALALLLLLLPGSWIKHLFDLYQERIGQSIPVSVFLSPCLSHVVPNVCTQTPQPLPAFPCALFIHHWKSPNAAFNWPIT